MSDITLDKLNEKLDMILEKLETKEEVIMLEDTLDIIEPAKEDNNENIDIAENVEVSEEADSENNVESAESEEVIESADEE